VSSRIGEVGCKVSLFTSLLLTTLPPIMRDDATTVSGTTSTSTSVNLTAAGRWLGGGSGMVERDRSPRRNRSLAAASLSAPARQGAAAAGRRASTERRPKP